SRDASSSTPAASCARIPARSPPRSTTTTTRPPASSPHPWPSAPPATPASASPTPGASPPPPAPGSFPPTRPDSQTGGRHSKHFTCTSYGWSLNAPRQPTVLNTVGCDQPNTSATSSPSPNGWPVSATDLHAA